MQNYSQPFLPTINKNFSEVGCNAALLKKTTLHRIHYPPIRNKVAKENIQSVMIQSCMTNDNYDELIQKKNEDKIRKNFDPSQHCSVKQIEPVSNYIGKSAPLKYYLKYKNLDKNLQKRDLNRFSLDSGLQLQSPALSLLEKAQSLRILPLCLGLVKNKGDISVLNVSDYNLGDKYVMALSAGIKKSRTLQKILLSGNRMTDLALADLAESISQEVTVLDLSRNKITKLDNKILEMIIEPQFRLQSLGIANNHLKVNSADAIFRSASYSKHIRRLDLRFNKLGTGCLESLSELLQKSTTLEQLYIGGNHLSGHSGQKIFNSLQNNKQLRVFDYSLNQLGDDGNNNTAQSIANCLQSNRTLQHLDLSFNNFSKEASQIIAVGLEPNKNLYGIHFRGNYGYIDAKGFLIIAQRQGTVLHSVDTFRMDSFSITCPRQQNALDSHMYRDVCWICQGWYEVEFNLSFPKLESSCLIFIHFDFEKYQPRLISITENIKYITMVPPKKYRYFLTVNNQFFLDPNTPCQTLPFTETHTYEMNNEPKTFTVSKVNLGKGKPKKIVNQWNEVIIKTLPRCNGLTIKKKKEPWQFDRSVWAKQMKLQNQQLLKKCFERDWKCSKLTSLIKAQSDQDKVKDILWSAYVDIKYMYKYYSSWNPFGDIWAVSSNSFTEFCQQAKIISKDTPLKIIDLTFITTNSISGANYKGNSLVPERGLVRFQFMEELVRLAEQKYKKLGLTDNFADSISTLLKEHVLPLSKSYNFQAWREKQYFNEFNDSLIKKYRTIFSSVYKKNSKAKVKPGQKPFMCLNEFKSIFDRMGLSNILNQRQIFIAFNNAMMTQVQELQNQKFMKMTQIQFIEGVARCASLLPSNNTVEPTQNPPLHLKLEWMAQQLRLLLPEEQRSQLPQIEVTMFREQEQQ